MDTHRAMGHEAPHQRWSHLFINGIYWGPYLITERVDDEFAQLLLKAVEASDAAERVVESNERDEDIGLKPLEPFVAGLGRLEGLVGQQRKQLGGQLPKLLRLGGHKGR